ncbi:MAG: DUF1684 domain-containing protein [Bryobacteraceae bacterium]|nr:DUF1684 domain-containing protein [Bryobacteraceae bacterium]
MFRALLLAFALASSDYQTSIDEWRTQRETTLKAEDGWLSLTGLFWLNEGENTIGSKRGSRVELPPGSPVQAGVLFRKGRVVTFQADDRVEVRLNGQRSRAAELRTDKSGTPDVLGIGRIRLHIIERGTKLGVRMKDPDGKARSEFQGLKWFPVDNTWNVKARFVPKPRKMVFDAQAGDKQEYQSPGYVEWERKGQTLQLTPVREGERLFFVFRDATSGRSTYAAARFIYTALPVDGHVSLDFNQAYNPPCVFTPYATCPLPPPENRLTVPVDAGEMMYTTAASRRQQQHD